MFTDALVFATNPWIVAITTAMPFAIWDFANLAEWSTVTESPALVARPGSKVLSAAAILFQNALCHALLLEAASILACPTVTRAPARPVRCWSRDRVQVGIQCFPIRLAI